jgi:transposase-like protein
MRMLANVQQTTIQPLIETAVAKGARIHTDEDDISARLEIWGYQHRAVCHARCEYARDEDDDGFCEVHVNTLEDLCSLLRSWLRPHRGVSQEKLPISLGLFQFVHTPDAAAKPSSVPLSPPWWHDVTFSTPDPDKSLCIE